MGQRLTLPGSRSLRATLDTVPEAEAAVVAAPPHPQMGGSRSDPRLGAVSDALATAGIACLRFDYGDWDGGRAEQADVATALAWASREFATVGLFGYSFGAGVTTLATANRDLEPAALAVLAPPATIVATGDVADAVSDIDVPAQVVVGERDDTVDWEPVHERAAAAGWRTDIIPADHHFVGQHDRVGRTVGEFLERELG